MIVTVLIAELTDVTVVVCLFPFTVIVLSVPLTVTMCVWVAMVVPKPAEGFAVGLMLTEVTVMVVVTVRVKLASLLVVEEVD